MDIDVKLRFLFNCFVSLLGFSLIATASAEVSFPADWGQLTQEKMVGSKCPSIAGSYSVKAITYRQDDKDSVYYLDDRNNIGSNYILFQRNELSYLNKSDSQKLSNDLVYFVQNSSESVSIIFYDGIFGKDFTKVSFDRSKNSLLCENGWWALQRLSSQGGTEGYVSDWSATRLISRLSNGDLVIRLKTRNTRTDWFIFRNITTTDTFLKLQLMPN